MLTIDKIKVDEIIDELLGNNDLTASPEVWYGLHEIKNLQPVSTDTNVGDTISRQAAIDAVHNSYDNILDFTSTGKTVADSIEDIISELPSAQPEPKEGHWIDKGWNGDWAWQIDGRGNCWRVIECSECGKSVSVESNYCPHCGADMRGEQDGNA